jgi:hypothetical protein
VKLAVISQPLPGWDKDFLAGLLVVGFRCVKRFIEGDGLGDVWVNRFHDMGCFTKYRFAAYKFPNEDQ